MDVVLDYADHYLLTPYVYPETWQEKNPLRQLISLFAVVNIGGYILYLSTAAFSYYFIFDHRLMKHSQILPNQVRREIRCACESIPLMSVPTIALFFLEVRGYSRLYDNVHDTKLGWLGLAGSAVTFILFTDMGIYWIHRFLHHKHVYRYLHKKHHMWKVPTPFASHAFHPIDGFLQSVPYHVYAFLFPLHKMTYLVLFVFVNIWTVSIHDGDYRVPKIVEPYVNGSAHHMDHHLFYSYNYGQFFTLWDRLGGSFRYPSSLAGCGPMKEVMELEKKNGTVKRKSGNKKKN